MIRALRAGDLPAFWADANSALADLSWSTTKTVDEMCEDHWRWQKTIRKGIDAEHQNARPHSAQVLRSLAGGLRKAPELVMAVGPSRSSQTLPLCPRELAQVDVFDPERIGLSPIKSLVVNFCLVLDVIARIPFAPSDVGFYEGFAEAEAILRRQLNDEEQH